MCWLHCAVCHRVGKVTVCGRGPPYPSTRPGLILGSLRDSNTLTERARKRPANRAQLKRAAPSEQHATEQALPSGFTAEVTSVLHISRLLLTLSQRYLRQPR